jgi:hypothetical protein
MPDRSSRSSRQDLAKLPALVRMVKALEEAVQAVSDIESKYDLTPQQRDRLRSQLAKEVARRAIAADMEKVRMPKAAPELWGDRKGRKENPVAFIRRVYAPWLDRGLKRGDLRTLDQQLYQALAVWMHRHPDLEFAELDIEPSSPAATPQTRAPGLAEAWAKGKRSAKLSERK